MSASISRGSCGCAPSQHEPHERRKPASGTQNNCAVLLAVLWCVCVCCAGCSTVVCVCVLRWVLYCGVCAALGALLWCVCCAVLCMRIKTMGQTDNYPESRQVDIQAVKRGRHPDAGRQASGRQIANLAVKLPSCNDCSILDEFLASFSLHFLGRLFVLLQFRHKLLVFFGFGNQQLNFALSLLSLQLQHGTQALS